MSNTICQFIYSLTCFFFVQVFLRDLLHPILAIDLPFSFQLSLFCAPCIYLSPATGATLLVSSYHPIVHNRSSSDAFSIPWPPFDDLGIPSSILCFCYMSSVCSFWISGFHGVSNHGSLPNPLVSMSVPYKNAQH